MMGLKTILAVISDTETGVPTLETAFLVGRDHACHVRVLHSRPDPASVVPMVGEAMSGMMVDEMMTACDRDGQERAAKVRELFEAVCNRYTIPVTDEPPGPPEMSAALVLELGLEDDVVLQRGRMSDLIVLGRPHSQGEPAWQATLTAALMETARPVLVAPRAPIAALGSTCAIAWNGSLEATRAVFFALPFLLKAGRVVILTVEDVSGQAAAELDTYLAWHGITTEVRALPANGSSGAVVGEALLDCCKGLEADLLVMGAYTHSRLRQLILGGVTRHVLDHAELPVLLSH